VPDNAPESKSKRFDQVDRQRQRWLDYKIAASEIDSAKWITQEWVRFLEGLPAEIAPERLVELDNQFRFSGAANGEIAQRWYPIAELNGYFEARPAMAAFLQRIGRRKLIMPTYEALVKTESGLAFAKEVFASARPGYHPITTASVEKVIAEAKPVAGPPMPAADAQAAPPPPSPSPAMPAADGDATRPAPTPQPEARQAPRAG
jgi:hypothetical protein